MKKHILALAVMLVALSTHGQEINESLKPFTRLIASPKINVVLQKGEAESIRLVYSGVSSGDINIEVHHKTLSIYLDGARVLEKNDYKNHRYSEERYHGASITAYVTYKQLRYLEVRGNQEVTSLDPLSSEVFTIKAYGENTITLNALYTSLLHTSLYGENCLNIQGGKAYEQQFHLFGENKIDTEKLTTHDMAMNIFGEGKMSVNAISSVRVTAFGEPHIHVTGGAHIRRIVFGVAHISRE